MTQDIVSDIIREKWPVLTSNVIDSQYKIVILTQNQDSDFFQSYCSPEGCHSPWLWKRSNWPSIGKFHEYFIGWIDS